eukprot:TRINITY_DN29004_c0_g1_i3.p2 TRINITY_DN29004_c0_g1~~TRINITY_DN29004_c0_g1_i3.p2  ORF type:complete len:110 (-),score=25.66 TRINITY_DN29004_c0_g1_i3:93-422(-)
MKAEHASSPLTMMHSSLAFRVSGHEQQMRFPLFPSLGVGLGASSAALSGASHPGGGPRTIVPSFSPYSALIPVSYTHLRAHETPEHLVCRLLLEKKKKNNKKTPSSNIK